MIFQTEKPDEDWMSRLDERGFTRDTKHQDDPLKHRLLQHGGWAVILRGDQDIDAIIDGQCHAGEGALLLSGAPNNCHGNAAAIFLRNPARFKIGTGYALSQDGVWRQHSWVHDGDKIIETTTPRVAYFGYQLNGDRGLAFARAQQ